MAAHFVFKTVNRYSYLENLRIQCYVVTVNQRVTITNLYESVWCEQKEIKNYLFAWKERKENMWSTLELKQLLTS